MDSDDMFAGMMAFLFVGMLTFFVWAACFAPGTDKQACYASVEKVFPHAQQITYVPGNDYKFVVKDNDGAIWYVDTMNLRNADITRKVALIK